MPRDIKQLDTWLLAHRIQAQFWSLGIAILVLELAVALRLGCDWIARHIAGGY